jgi:hypothetical protein
MTRFGIVLGVQALVACCGPAAAATLEQEACARLKTELMQLELGGARSSMAKGPEWAKVNLPADKLQQIKRLIEVEEQILFRCQGKPLVVLPEGVDGEAAAGTDRKEGVAATPAKEPPKALPPGKAQGPASGPASGQASGQGQAKAPAPPHPKAAGPAAKPPAGPAASKTGAARAAEPPITSTQPKPKPLPAAPKAKPKVDDAYKPAPVPPGTDPFAAKP